MFFFCLQLPQQWYSVWQLWLSPGFLVHMNTNWFILTFHDYWGVVYCPTRQCNGPCPIFIKIYVSSTFNLQYPNYSVGLMDDQEVAAGTRTRTVSQARLSGGSRQLGDSLAWPPATHATATKSSYFYVRQIMIIVVTQPNIKPRPPATQTHNSNELIPFVS